MYKHLFMPLDQKVFESMRNTHSVSALCTVLVCARVWARTRRSSKVSCVYTPLITRVPVSAGVSIQSTESQTDTYSFPQCESRERERGQSGESVSDRPGTHSFHLFILFGAEGRS